MTNNQQLAAITAEERAALIAECEADIELIEISLETCAERHVNRQQSQLKLRQIALASLEAPINHWVNESIFGFLAEKEKPEDDPLSAPWIAGYTAPPVAVMQPVVLPKPYGMQDHEKWLLQPEVIEAIRAAGGSVKE